MLIWETFGCDGERVKSISKAQDIMEEEVSATCYRLDIVSSPHAFCCVFPPTACQLEGSRKFLRRAYGLLAQEVGGASSCAPSCVPSCVCAPAWRAYCCWPRRSLVRG